MKVESFVAPRNGRLCSPREASGIHFCYRLSRLKGRSEKSKWHHRESAVDLPACSAVPQPTEPPRARTLDIIFSCCILVHLQAWRCTNWRLKRVTTRQTSCLKKVVVFSLILKLVVHVSVCNLLTSVGASCRVHKPRVENRRNPCHIH